MLSLLLTLIVLAGCVAALAFVFAPLRHPEQVQAPDVQIAPLSPSARRLESLVEQREAALAGLAELDFDHTLGNLSEADYGNLRAQYRAQAIGVLKAVDTQVGRTMGPDARSGRIEATGLGQSHPVREADSAVIEKPVSKRGIFAIGAAISVALLVIAAGTASLRGSATPSSEGATALDVLHTHAALAIPGTEVILVAHHTGLLRSVDGGRTWQSVAGVAGDVLSLAGGAQGGKWLYLATAGEIKRSSNQGTTWEAIPLPSAGAQISALATGRIEQNPDDLFAVVSGAGIFRTGNGRDWNLLGAGLPAGITSLALVPAPASALYAASPNAGVLATGDVGKTWGSANGVLTGVLPPTTVRTLAFDPESGDTFMTAGGLELRGVLYAGTDAGLFKSIDGGSSWTALPLTEPLSAVSARSSPSPLIVAVDSRSRVWRSSDRGGSWSAKP